jgi:hypothetical protein
MVDSAGDETQMPIESGYRWLGAAVNVVEQCISEDFNWFHGLALIALMVG